MSIYEELGGDQAFQAALDHFYGKVMADPPVATFFDGMDVEQIKQKQRQFWAIALGGESTYTGRDMKTAHQKPRADGLNEPLFDRFIGHFRATLEEFNVPEEKIQKVLAVTDRYKDEVLDR